MLRAPEPAREGRRADRVALAGPGVAGRAAVAADPVAALLVAEDIAAGTLGELRPASLERPVGPAWNGCSFCSRNVPRGSVTILRRSRGTTVSPHHHDECERGQQSCSCAFNNRVINH
jgi:hypothetical protein